MLADTIAALATAPGRAALALIRLSGPDAFTVAARVVPGFHSRAPRCAHLARFITPEGDPLDVGLWTAFPGPRSYTGEDLVELSCHGGLVVPARVLSALFAAGARPAAPGEFTLRAVRHGRMTLMQAEAVGDLIEATSPAQARVALHQVEGGLASRIEELRTQLLDLSALLGYHIDFPEEDDGPVGWEDQEARRQAVVDGLDLLLRTAPLGSRLREGALVVLAGRPNSGKSSLFNALLGTARALVTERPGTTRDAVEADTTFLDWPVRLADTAGLRDAEDMVERLGIEVSRRYLEAADLVLLCAEAGRVLDEGERTILASRPALLVRTKADLLAGSPPAAVEGVPASVVSGEGLDAIRAAVVERMFGVEGVHPTADMGPLLVRERHRVALERARRALEEVRPHLGPTGDAALAAHHVRQAVIELEELLGGVDSDEVLGRIFSRFCVGK